jgi:hypothetical protein
MEYYRYEDHEIVIPRLFGAEVKKDGSSGKGRRKWDEESFLEDARRKLNATQFKTVSEVYEFSKRKADELTWGTGRTRGSFNPKFLKISPKSLYTVRSNGTLSINFGWLAGTETANRYKREFKKELEGIKGIELPEDWEQAWVYFPIEKWQPVARDFMRAVDRLLAT